MHEKTFAAIRKLQEVEIELHRLKESLELTSRSLDTALNTIDNRQVWEGLVDILNTGQSSLHLIFKTREHADKVKAKIRGNVL